MVNDNGPSVADYRDDLSVSDNSVSAPATSSVDLSSQRDSDIAQTLRNQPNSVPDFLNNLTIQIDSAPTGGASSGADNGGLNGIRKDGPYVRGADDSAHTKDGPYRTDPGGRVVQPMIEPGPIDSSKPLKGSIRDKFPELFPPDGENLSGRNPIGRYERDQTPGRKPSWLDKPQPRGIVPIGEPPQAEPIDLDPKKGEWRTGPIEVASIDYELPHPETGANRPDELIPNGKHPRGGGGDNTGGDRHDTKPSPIDGPRTTDPNETSQPGTLNRRLDVNSVDPDRSKRTLATMARWYHSHD